MKTAFITGGGAGIGAEIVRLAAEKGYRVGIFDRSEDTAKALAAEVPNSVPLAGDVTDEASVEAALDALGEVPDLVVNNAGVVAFGHLVDQTPEEFRRVVDINLVGAHIVARCTARRMIPRGIGSIVNITSINALNPSPGSGAYPASKAGLTRMTEQLALELGPLGIRVNAVAPGLIDGGMSEEIYKNQKTRALRTQGVPQRRLGSLRDIANAVLFLGSDDASYVSGHELVVDGALTPSVLAQLPRE
ncbi:MAG: SDR family NAD(P)-dependent oxidoreductase [Pseudomonadota bacterium]|nr:SDR family NAD(P)-dependent oxidoreductase [Pseudomonadota bacterium]